MSPRPTLDHDQAGVSRHPVVRDADRAGRREHRSGAEAAAADVPKGGWQASRDASGLHHVGGGSVPCVSASRRRRRTPFVARGAGDRGRAVAAGERGRRAGRQAATLARHGPRTLLDVVLLTSARRGIRPAPSPATTAPAARVACRSGLAIGGTHEGVIPADAAHRPRRTLTSDDTPKALSKEEGICVYAN